MTSKFFSEPDLPSTSMDVVLQTLLSKGIPIINSKDISLQGEIGVGGQARVYRGQYQGRDVAIKEYHGLYKSLLNPDPTVPDFQSRLDSLFEELNQLRQNHEKLVRLYGVILHPLSIVMELMPNGSLFGLLHNNSSRRLTRLLQLVILREIAEGLEFLHSRSYIHRDLKSDNVLLDFSNSNQIRVVLSDFGITKFQEATQQFSKCCGTFAWMAPEVIASKPSSQKVDIYSFGVLAWEVVTQQLPWKGEGLLLVSKVVAGERPPIPTEIDPKLRSLIERCWHQDPAVRPSASKLCVELRQLVNGELQARSNAKEAVHPQPIEPIVRIPEEDFHVDTPQPTSRTQLNKTELNPEITFQQTPSTVTLWAAALSRFLLPSSSKISAIEYD